MLNGTQLGGQNIRLSWGRSPSNKQAVCFTKHLKMLWPGCSLACLYVKMHQLIYRVSPLVSPSQIQTSGTVDIMDMHMDMKAMDMHLLPKIRMCMDIPMEITSSSHHSSKLGIVAKKFGFLLWLPLFSYLINKFGRENCLTLHWTSS